MSRPNTTFDKPEMELAPDPQGARMYANVDNQIVRYLREDGDAYKLCPAQVPTAMFSLMRDVFAVDPSDEVQMYLAVDGEFFVFGIAWGTSDFNVADLWAYSADKLPHFLR